MKEGDEAFPAFLEKVVEFPDGGRYELLDPLTQLRECQDGTPPEARILLNCRRFNSDSSQYEDDQLVMKVKVQYGVTRISLSMIQAHA